MSSILDWMMIIGYGIVAIGAPLMFLVALVASALGIWRKSTRLGVKAVSLALTFAFLCVGQVIAPSDSFQPFMIIACIAMPVAVVIYSIHAVSCRLDEQKKRAERATAPMAPQE